MINNRPAKASKWNLAVTMDPVKGIEGAGRRLKSAAFYSALLIVSAGYAAAATSPTETVAEYIDACRVGDASRLEAIFHNNAIMSGYSDGGFYFGSPRPFFDEVRDNPSPSTSGSAYAAQISHVEVSGEIASVVMQEQGYFGDNYTNMFHLVKIDGMWIIVSKVYQQQD